jgi:UDP-2,3-diacylglucosamine hydrolase
MHSIFISDLHLAPERPKIVEVFFRFVVDSATHAHALYILGDLFETWVGDDDLEDAFNARVAEALSRLTSGGTRLYLMHGNRDLLMGRILAARCGARLISDPYVADLHGAKTLLMHGDTLCSDDVDYQKFRAHVHSPDVQRAFLAQPLSERRRQVQGLRAESEESKQRKTEEIMDVAPATVEEALRSHGYPRLIHGHTHRPGRHVHVVDGHACERWVLPDWYTQGGYLRCNAEGCTAIAL